jgi:regulatory protein
MSPYRAPRPKKVLNEKSVKAAAYDLLARKAWSRSDLIARLKRRGASDGVAREVVAELEARGYVDDRAFAGQWAEARARGLGSRRLSEELRRRGIPRPLADEAVGATFAAGEEALRALEAARKRLPALAKRNPGRAPVRLRDFLLRRGYPAEVVNSVVHQLCKIDEPE